MNWRLLLPGLPKGTTAQTRTYGSRTATILTVPRGDGLSDRVTVMSHGRGGALVKDGVPGKLGITNGVRYGSSNDRHGHWWSTRESSGSYRDTPAGTLSRYGAPGVLDSNARFAGLIRDTSAFGKALQSSADQTIAHVRSGNLHEATTAANQLSLDLGEKAPAGKILSNLQTQNKATLKLANKSSSAVRARALALHKVAESARTTAAGSRVDAMAAAKLAASDAARISAVVLAGNRTIGKASLELSRATAKVAATEAGTAARVAAVEAERAARVALEEAQKNAQRAAEAARQTAQASAEAARVAAHTAAVTTVEASRAAALAAGAVVGAAFGALR